MTDIQFHLWAYMVNSRLAVLTLMVIYHVQPKVNDSIGTRYSNITPKLSGILSSITLPAETKSL